MVIKLKKAIRTLLIIICLLFVSSLSGCRITANASSIMVPDDYPTIQQAINAANQRDTIFVKSGTYVENIIVNKTVSLIGENRETTIIDGDGIDNVVSIDASAVSIEGFTIRNSGIYPPRSGIGVGRPSEGNTISNNKIMNNFEGMSIYSSSNNVISDNMISDNVFGISLYSSSINVISNNTISSNDDGIYLYSSSINVISHNIIVNNKLSGISLYYRSSNNIVRGNTISDNHAGIWLFFYSSNNTFYHNNLNNTNQAWSEPDLRNAWNNTEEGNYWNNYSGQDLNGDGIGDIPHVIDENNRDHYPLKGVFCNFEIAWKSETYYVAVISNSTLTDFNFDIGTETGNRIIRFKTSGEEGSSGFSRVKIPIQLMQDPYIVLVGGEEVVPTLLNMSDMTNVYLYITYLHNNLTTVSIISSKTLWLYYELLAEYLELQKNFYNLNKTYYDLLTNYTKLHVDLENVNSTYYSLLAAYDELQNQFNNLNVTYYGILNAYGFLFGNYSALLESFQTLNASYHKHLAEYSIQVQNFQSLTYIFASITAIFLIALTYLSKHVHISPTTKTKDEK